MVLVAAEFLEADSGRAGLVINDGIVRLTC